MNNQNDNDVCPNCDSLITIGDNDICPVCGKSLIGDSND
jgi:RNA polymerase subunit RPABC4/transcription elongation factor Spt4